MAFSQTKNLLTASAMGMKNPEFGHTPTVKRTKIKGLIRDFLLRYPEARGLFIGEDQNSRIIDSPRLLIRRMQEFTSTREAGMKNFQGIISQAQKTNRARTDKHRSKKFHHKFQAKAAYQPISGQPEQGLLSKEFSLSD